MRIAYNAAVDLINGDYTGKTWEVVGDVEEDGALYTVTIQKVGKDKYYLVTLDTDTETVEVTDVDDL